MPEHHRGAAHGQQLELEDAPAELVPLGPPQAGAGLVPSGGAVRAGREALVRAGQVGATDPEGGPRP